MENLFTDEVDYLGKKNLVTIKKASEVLSSKMDRLITVSNLSYLVTYGKIRLYKINKKTLIDLDEVINYYLHHYEKMKQRYIDKEGKDLNWHLSFDWVKESERTKHVHRIHPYKGKFIPQLVEYFLDSHTNDLKTEIYFKEGDIVLDPFAGSGTTLIQANELGLHSIGVEISEFNSLLTKVKFAEVNIEKLKEYIKSISSELNKFEKESKIDKLQEEIDEKIGRINNLYFKSPDFKINFREGKISDEYIDMYVKEAKEAFIRIYGNRFKNSNEKNEKSFLRTWLMPSIFFELEKISKSISKIEDNDVRNAIIIIMSRSIHSARSTAHTDLDRLTEPVYEPYFCYKHFKVCKPVISLVKFFERYAWDTVKRLEEYERLKTKAFQCIITADSRKIDIFKEVKKQNLNFYRLLKEKKIKGIFTSPPYIGQLDYHDLHAYAYEFFNIGRNDEDEIGSSESGKGNIAKQRYIEDISKVLINVRKFTREDSYIFIVANDQFSLYPEIASRSGLVIEKQFKRPVLNRTARDKSPYSETIFLMRFKNKKTNS